MNKIKGTNHDVNKMYDELIKTYEDKAGIEREVDVTTKFNMSTGADDSIDEQKRLAKEKADERARDLQSLKDSYRTELEVHEAKYAKELELAKGNAELIKKIKERKAKEYDELTGRSAYLKELKVLEDAGKTKLQLLDEQYKVELTKYTNLLTNKIISLEEYTKMEDLLSEQHTINKQKLIDEENKLLKDNAQKIIDSQKDYAKDELELAEQKYKEDLKILQDALDKKLITQDQYNKSSTTLFNQLLYTRSQYAKEEADVYADELTKIGANAGVDLIFSPIEAAYNRLIEKQLTFKNVWKASWESMKSVALKAI